MRRTLLLLLALFGLAFGALAAPAANAAGDDEFAPLDRPGPALNVPQDKLDASLVCTKGVDGATRTPVLLNPATGVTAEQNYAWNYERALTMLGIPWCAYTAPSSTLGDIQISGEYLVHAIRTMHARAGRRIAIIGHSQGGMSMRWPLRFWPDTRAMVDDVIGFAGSNHGTTAGTGGSQHPPAVFQQGRDARFLQALNSRAETFGGISYTNVYTHTDEVVQPSTGPNPSSALHTGGGAITNVATQDVCPTDVDEHLSVGTVDPVAYALALDALTHDGPADPKRIDPAVCARATQPGVDPANVAMYQQILAGAPGLAAVGSPVPVPGFPYTDAEPKLACYTLASCGATTPAGGGRKPQAHKRRCTSRRRFRTHLRRGLRHVHVRVDGRRVKVRRRHGRATAVVDLRGKGRKTVVVRIRAVGRHGHRFHHTRRYHTCKSGRR